MALSCGVHVRATATSTSSADICIRTASLEPSRDSAVVDSAVVPRIGQVCVAAAPSGCEASHPRPPPGAFLNFWLELLNIHTAPLRPSPHLRVALAVHQLDLARYKQAAVNRLCKGLLNARQHALNPRRPVRSVPNRNF